MGAGFRVQAKAGQPRTGEVYIYEDVGEGWFGGVGSKTFSAMLDDLGSVDQIDVRINSYGGDVFDGFAMYRRLVDHKANVTTYVDGIAASIASVIAMAGNQIKIAEAGQIMIHNAWSITLGPADDHRATADRLDMTTASIADVYAARTGNKVETLRAWMKAETDFNSARALEVGFADEVVQNLRLAAAVRVQPTKLTWGKALPHFRPSDQRSPERPRFDRAVEQSARMRAWLLLAHPHKSVGH